MKKSIFLFTIFVCLLGFSGLSSAIEISSDDITIGDSTIYLDGATLYSSPGAFDKKTVDGIEGFGVDGGYVDGEIDLADEVVTISFDLPTLIEQITLGFLFKDGYFGDQVSEVARIVFSADPWKAGDLSVIDPDTATWSGPSGNESVQNLSLGDDDHAGVWKISNPFGDYLVSELKFTALEVGNNVFGSKNSDFSIVSISGSPVPEPGTIILLGSGLLGLAAYGRKRKFFKK